MIGLETHFRYIREKMKSKDLQTAVKNKYKNGDGPAKIYRDLGGVVSLPTIKLWIKMMKNTGSINLSYSHGRPRTVRTKSNISKVKSRLAHKKRVSKRRLAAEMNISRRSAQRILREDLGCFPYKKIKQPKLTDLQKKRGLSLPIGY
jgi:transposase